MSLILGPQTRVLARSACDTSRPHCVLSGANFPIHLGPSRLLDQRCPVATALSSLQAPVSPARQDELQQLEDSAAVQRIASQTSSAKGLGASGSRPVGQLPHGVSFIADAVSGGLALTGNYSPAS